ncbi:hypothetical protein DZF91_15565 [Actinomadura logoneensis]|uniref:Uncharacterized protein n=1 Tax=Actinomadura logoneensis TaxID=2293572 RepID=A0A372JL44_9ACTN|nr:hypothetical protein [Actinomadura logoneensis]RFU40737.1 hypothetical protein DZF91_15565 [Actinomadura logoneensis]
MKARRKTGAPVTARRPWGALVLSVALTAAMFAGAVLCLREAVTQGDATSRAAAGKGRPGVFVVDVRRCSRTCSWYGVFIADGNGDGADVRPNARDRELRGAHEASLSPGQRLRVRDVGAFVQTEGGSAEWGSTTANAIGTFFLSVTGVLGAVSAAGLWRRRFRRDASGRREASGRRDASGRREASG